MTVPRYTNRDAVRDLMKFRIGPDLYITPVLAWKLVPEPLVDGDTITESEAVRRGLSLIASVKVVLDRYWSGDYGDDPESNIDLAVYEVDGHEVWAMWAADGLTLLQPCAEVVSFEGVVVSRSLRKRFEETR
jgi:hypothetical protein